MSELMIPNGFGGLSLTTLDGQDVPLPAGANVYDLMPRSGSSEPLWRIAVGQPKDARFREASDQFFLTRKVSKTDERTGETKRVAENLGPLGTELTVWPIGMVANRAYLPPYDPNATDMEPYCRSENFVQPDARYMGKFSTRCCAIDPKTRRLVPVCPMAQWGAKGANGKSAPPACGESYVIAVALSLEIDGETQMIVAECYFKSASASNGKNLSQMLRATELRGEKMFNTPMKLTVKEVGQGNTFAGVLLTNEKQDFNQDDLDGFTMAEQRWQQALNVRAERAVMPSDEQVEAMAGVVRPEDVGLPPNATQEQIDAELRKGEALQGKPATPPKPTAKKKALI